MVVVGTTVQGFAASPQSFRHQHPRLWPGAEAVDVTPADPAAHLPGLCKAGLRMGGVRRGLRRGLRGGLRGGVGGGDQAAARRQVLPQGGRSMPPQRARGCARSCAPHRGRPEEPLPGQQQGERGSTIAPTAVEMTWAIYCGSSVTCRASSRSVNPAALVVITKTSAARLRSPRGE